MNRSGLKRHILLALIFTFTAAANATPIVFNFTGTIGSQMLDGGQMIKAWATVPKWNGKTVSGSISMDLAGVQPAAQNEEQITYETSATKDASEQWLKVFINNPDGTTYDFPTFTNFPEAKFNYSSTTLLDTSSGFSIFTLSRGFTNFNSKRPPFQQIQFRLTGFGDGSYPYDSLDFNTVNFNPVLANYVNSAYVGYLMDDGKKLEYFFRIDSLTRVETEVPEPGSMILMMLGFAGLLLNQRRIQKYQN